MRSRVAARAWPWAWRLVRLGVLSMLVVGCELPHQGLGGALKRAAVAVGTLLALVLLWLLFAVLEGVADSSRKWTARVGAFIMILILAGALLWDLWVPLVAEQDWAPKWVIELNARLTERKP
jgi:hypothetical protein